MASIVGKKISGKTYYYLVESARVGGKPRIVSQQYLGPADEVTARLAGSGPGEPERSRHLAFGDLAAVWGMLDRAGYAGIVDEVTGGAAVGRDRGRGHLPGAGVREPGGGAAVEAGVRGLVVHHGRGPG